MGQGKVPVREKKFTHWVEIPGTGTTIGTVYIEKFQGQRVVLELELYPDYEPGENYIAACQVISRVILT